MIGYSDIDRERPPKEYEKPLKGLPAKYDDELPTEREMDEWKHRNFSLEM